MATTELAARIDHTILAPETTLTDVARITAEALEYHFAAVCVAPRFVSTVAKAVSGRGVKTAAVVAFPHGTSKPTIKAIEATSCIKDGADEIDVVAHLPSLLALDLDAAKSELLEITRAARACRNDVVIKVIVESALLLKLPDDQAERAIEIACRAVRESGCDFIKTSTGFHPAGGASIRAIELMKKYAHGIQIKASGGIRDYPTAHAMLQAGADRIGASASIAILRALPT